MFCVFFFFFCRPKQTSPAILTVFVWPWAVGRYCPGRSRGRQGVGAEGAQGEGGVPARGRRSLGGGPRAHDLIYAARASSPARRRERRSCGREGSAGSGRPVAGTAEPAEPRAQHPGQRRPAGGRRADLQHRGQRRARAASAAGPPALQRWTPQGCRPDRLREPPALQTPLRKQTPLQAPLRKQTPEAEKERKK